MHTGTGLIAGRYRLEGLFGTGGSASVFAGVDVETGRAVAVKLLHATLTREEALREAFLGEARTARRFTHPNLVEVLDFGVHDTGDESIAWIVMEAVEGTTLAEYVDLHGPLSVAQSLAMVDGILRALEEVHREGLVHRDVTPANVMIAPSDGVLEPERVRLLDFGLADASGLPAVGSDVLRSTRTDDSGADAVGVLGSVNYLSPEHAMGMPVEAAGDIYETGGVLFFALTGRHPFPGGSPEAVMRAHINTPPPVPSTVRAGIPRAVDRLVVKAMLKQPETRFSSAGEMRGAVVALGAVGRAKTAPGSPTRLTTRAAEHPDDTTRVFDAAGAMTQRLGPVASVSSKPATIAVSGGEGTAFRRDRRTISGGWLAALLVIGLIAGTWAIAAAGVPQRPDAGPAPTPTATPTPTPTVEEPPPRVVVETPPETSTMPRVDGLIAADARARLTEAGLAVGQLIVEHSTSAVDTVLAASVAEGAQVPPGTVIDLTVASGWNAVPAVAGSTRDEGTAALQNAGFSVQVSIVRNVGGTGAVLRSEPGDGTILRLGSTVILVVSLPPIQPTLPPTSTPTPTTPPPTSAP